MSTTHIVIGAKVGAYFQQIVNQHDAFQGKLLIIEDDLSVGPLKNDNLSFSEQRALFWNTLELQSRNHILTDLESVMDLSTALSNHEVERVVLWINPSAQDLCSYYFLLFFLKKHISKLFIININGLPFLDDELKLYFPTSFLDINLKGILKATKLARPISYTEIELALDEWSNLRKSNSQLRITNSLNKLQSLNSLELDEYILAKLPTDSIKHNALLKVLNPLQSAWKDIFYSYCLRTYVNEGVVLLENNLYSKKE